MSEGGTQKLARWLVEGEVGASSQFMAAIALGATPRHGLSYPHDPADLNRCLKLVRAAPEVKKHFAKIRNFCPEWAVIIDHWDELQEMFVNEVGWDWSKGREAKRTYRRMKELLDPIEAANPSLVRFGRMTIRATPK